MTIRGGGHPRPGLGSAPAERLDPPPRSSGTDAYYCIMVVVRPTRRRQVSDAVIRADQPAPPRKVLVLATLVKEPPDRRALTRRPSEKGPDHPQRDAVLAAVKAWPVEGGACVTLAATAILDGVCARRHRAGAGRDEETAPKSNKETDRKESKKNAVNPT
jgi:hypothetical protein